MSWNIDSTDEQNTHNFLKKYTPDGANLLAYLLGRISSSLLLKQTNERTRHIIFFFFSIIDCHYFFWVTEQGSSPPTTSCFRLTFIHGEAAVTSPTYKARNWAAHILSRWGEKLSFWTHQSLRWPPLWEMCIATLQQSRPSSNNDYRTTVWTKVLTAFRVAATWWQRPA